MVTNMYNLYSSPIIHAPLGSRDHNIVLWQPSLALRQHVQTKSPKGLVHHYPCPGTDAFGRWVTIHTLGTQDHKNTRLSYNFLSFYSITLKLGTKNELVIL